MSTSSQDVIPAQKALIRTARLLQKKTIVWVQGTVIWRGTDQLAIDDGSGVARVHLLNYEKRDIASSLDKLRLGSYIMVVGEMYSKFRGYRMGIKPSTIRDLSSHGPLTESLWNLEIVDSYLYQQEKSQDNAS